jgi:predicted AlkP superfamily phosphohydrolase/phosphomutase
VRRFLALTLLLFACARAEKRVIFVGLDGADWRLLDRFVADGTMPRLGEILQRAERRVLLTQHPPLSPLVWTTMMTGVSPLKHRILDFTRYSPTTRQQEPITSDERAVPAIWNMAAAQGKRAGVFGMWATYPPEPGVILTDRDLPRDYVEATEFTHQRAMKWIREQKPHLAIVYFQGTDEIGHYTSGDVEKARAYFRRIDAILDDYRKLAESLDAELVIASDHGFDWGGRHEESSTATATAAKWHRNEGVLVRWPRRRRPSA